MLGFVATVGMLTPSWAAFCGMVDVVQALPFLMVSYGSGTCIYLKSLQVEKRGLDAAAVLTLKPLQLVNSLRAAGQREVSKGNLFGTDSCFFSA